MVSESTAKKRVLSRSITTFFEDGRYLDVVTNQRRNISGSLLLTGASSRTLSSSTASSGGTVSSASFTLSRSADWTQRVEVPEVLESIESLQYLGFDLPTAQTILARYLTEPEPRSGDPLLSWACAHVGGPHWVSKIGDRSEPAFLDGLGISKELAEILLMPEFAAVRNTAPLTYWLVDTFKMRWSFLVEELEAGLQGQQQQIMRLRGGGAADDEVYLIDGEGATSPSDAGAEGEVEAVTAPLHLDGHTMLWRAGWRNPYEHIYDMDTGEINLGASYYLRGDFSVGARVYFTPQMETANEFLQFAKARHTPSELYIFQVAVPWALIESLKITILRCTGEMASTWRAIVWHSRNAQKPPRNLFHVAQAEILIGDVASKPQISYGRLASPDELTAAYALTVDIDGQQTNALQWVFQGDGELKFEEACRSKCWMHTLGAFRAIVKGE